MRVPTATKRTSRRSPNYLRYLREGKIAGLEVPNAGDHQIRHDHAGVSLKLLTVSVAWPSTRLTEQSRKHCAVEIFPWSKKARQRCMSNNVPSVSPTPQKWETMVTASAEGERDIHVINSQSVVSVVLSASAQR